MRTSTATLASVVAFAVFAARAQAQIRLPEIVGDGMVLQQASEVALWGKARPGATIAALPSWSDTAASATADSAGQWQVTLTTPAAGGPFTIQLSGDGERTLSDVWSGEVWLCSGQSNMEWAVAKWPAARSGVPGAAEESARANFPQLRLFDVPDRLSNYERVDSHGRWTVCSPDSVGQFSATAYYFGRKLHQELGVPIGLVTADWGGTPIEAWMSARALAPSKEFAAELEYLALSVDPNLRYEYSKRSGAGWWEQVDGAGSPPVAAAWTRSDFDDSPWKTMKLPATLAGDGLERFDGFVYFRTTVEIPAAWAGKSATLELGPIDDRDDAWFDGVHVGATREDGLWSAPRKYALGALSPGVRAIAVRVLDTGGIGGVNGPADALVVRCDDAALAPLALAGEWRYFVGPALSQLPPIGQTAVRIDANTPSVLFNGMLAPLRPLRFRGAIWYQGEANVGRAAQYERLFPALIADWRAQFGCGEFPFYFVQIAPFAYDGSSSAAAELRDAQRRALSVPRTGMALTMDIGDARDIHPGNKQEVGRRLALWALTQDYGRKMVSHCGPLYRSATLEGEALRVRFEHADGGLVAKGGALTGFIVAGADERFHEAKAVVDGDSVLVLCARVKRPVAVRYGWKDAAMPNLFNAAGLPASSFRSDDWSGGLTIIEDGGRTPWFSDEPGFAALFNGRDLAGWHDVNCAPSTWTVADGKIACSGVPTGVLRSDKQYENFVFEMEWRHLVAQGNAGLFVWSDPLTARGQPFTRSIEVQVMTGTEGPGFTSDGDVFPIHGAAMDALTGRQGPGRAFPTEKRMRPGGEWNHYRVTCVGGKLDLAVNGKVVTQGRDCKPRKGYICLESEGSPCEFRNLRIRELPSAQPALAADMVCDVDRGFRSLYSGVDFAGWKFTPEHAGHWKANDWTIAFDGQGPDLWSSEEFGDFELIADWRWSGPAHDADLAVILPSGEQALDDAGQPKTQRVREAGDSGIYLRGSSKSQVNIWCWPVGSGEVYGYRTDKTQSAAVRAGVTPRVAADRPLGEWNRFHITLVGESLTVVLNGQTVLENAQLPGVAPRGPIALQQHGAPIEFANIYVKPLD